MSIKIPFHICVIPDGNRRWARNKNLPLFEGHRQGFLKVLELIKWCQKRGIKILTIFCFSTENWNRSKQEVNYLMKLFKNALKKEIKNLQENNIQVKIIGEKEKLPLELQKLIQQLEEFQPKNVNLFLNLAISYGGRWDIIQAVKKIIKDKIPLNKINEKLFEKYLSTFPLPFPDLLIRVGGEIRISNFLLWQIAYSELYFCPKLWPDFTEEDFDLILEEFSQRERRFGR